MVTGTNEIVSTFLGKRQLPVRPRLGDVRIGLDAAREELLEPSELLFDDGLLCRDLTLLLVEFEPQRF